MADVVTHNGADKGDAPQPQSTLGPALGRRSVVLVGMMGAGKSSVGRRLAARLGVPFVDADVEIEKAAGMTISEIFAAHGEPYFRAGETRVIARLLEGGPQVLATGGGAFMNADTRAAIRAKGISVWLRATLDVLNRRIKRRGDRPLLKDRRSGGDAAQADRASAIRSMPRPTSRWNRATCRTKPSSMKFWRACAAASRPTAPRRDSAAP